MSTDATNHEHRFSVRSFTLVAAVVLLTLLVIYLSGFAAYVYLSGGPSGIHQRSVTRSLAEWEQEHRSVSSHEDAIRTANMLEYAQQYYVPGGEYRSTPEIEAALQMQRRETIEAFVKALRDYTGEDFGTDSAQWLKYLHDQTTE